MQTEPTTSQRDDKAAPDAVGTATGHGLHRTLRSRQLSMIAIGGAIGTGLFLGSSLAISKAGPAVILAYVAGGLVALTLAWALAEMTVVHPTAGSFGAIAHSYVGPWAGFVVRWTYWTAQVVAIGGEVVAAGIYVQFWWPDMPLWVPVVFFSAVMLAVNAAAVRFFGEFEYWFAMVKVTAIVAFIGLGLAYVVFGLPGTAPAGVDDLTSHGGFAPHGLAGVWGAMVVVVFSYIGTEVVAVTAAESEDPVRDVPRAARSMVLRLALFYVLAISVVVAIVPWTQTAKGGSLDASPFVRLFDLAGVPAAATVMNLVVLTAALSSMNTNLYVTTRMAHSLAHDGYAPAWMGRVSRSGVPRLALALSAAGLALAAWLSVTSPDTAFLALFGIAVFGGLTVWILILVTHAAFRRVRASRGLPASPVRLRGAPVTSALAGLLLVAVLVTTGLTPDMRVAWTAGAPFLVLLSVAYLVLSRRRGPASRPLLDGTADRTGGSTAP